MSPITAKVADAIRDRGASIWPAADEWPAPLGAAAYHGLLGEVVQAIAPQTEADPAALLMQTLAMFGNVIGRAAHFCVEGDRHYTALYVGIVGTTAKGRKGVSRGHVQRCFERVDSEWVRQCVTAGLSSGEGLIWCVRDPIEKQQPIRDRGRIIEHQAVVEDPGIIDKRLLVIESELASTLKVMAREGNTLSPVIRSAWDGHDLRTLTKNSAARATTPHVSIIGHITRDELRRYLAATECANGFGNRFLWVCVRRARELPDGGEHVNHEPFVARLRGAVQHAAQCGPVGRTPLARALWHRVYGRLSAGRPGLLGAMTARGEAQVMRLALLYALADAAPTIDVPHLRAGLEVWRYCFASARHLFGGRLGDPTADEILVALREAWPESLTRRGLLHDVFGRHRSADEIGRALALLVECRLARAEQDRSGKGRPAERWFAVPEQDDPLDLTPGDLTDQSPEGEAGLVAKVAWSPTSDVPRSSGDLSDQSLNAPPTSGDLSDQSPAVESPLVTRLRAALADRGAPMKVFDLGRALGAAPDLVHRTLRAHPHVFARVLAADHVDAWGLA